MSLNFENFLADVKRAALEAVVASKPFALTFGTVVSVSPLKITIDQKLTLNASQLVLTNAVRDFSVYMTVDHKTGTALSGTEYSHTHNYSGKKKFKVHLGLTVGERVILLRADGGQRYIVLDRVEAPT